MQPGEETNMKRTQWERRPERWLRDCGTGVLMSKGQSFQEGDAMIQFRSLWLLSEIRQVESWGQRWIWKEAGRDQVKAGDGVGKGAESRG